jgi:hypothetical protein
MPLVPLVFFSAQFSFMVMASKLLPQRAKSGQANGLKTTTGANTKLHV